MLNATIPTSNNSTAAANRQQQQPPAAISDQQQQQRAAAAAAAASSSSEQQQQQQRAATVSSSSEQQQQRASTLKPCTLILYSVELARPTPERAHLKGRYGQILRPSANPAVARHTRWAERQRHCSDGQRTPGFYYLLHEQGAHSFDVHSEGIHHGKQEDLMRLGDDEESRLVREAGGTFRGYSDKEPQTLNFKKPGQGGARARLLAKARAELDTTLVGYCCQEPGCEKQRIRPTMLCIRHGGGRRCHETLEDGAPCPTASVPGSTTEFCVGLCRRHIRKRKLSAAVDDAITAGAAAAATAAAITAAAFEEF